MVASNDGLVHSHRLLLWSETPIKSRLELVLGTRGGRHVEID